MDKNLENKLNQILEKVNQIDELSLQVETITGKVDKIDELYLKVDKIEKTMKSGFNNVDKKINTVDKKLEGYIKFSSERITNIEDNMATKKDIQNLKLDLVDRYADKETVLDHETRITNLEEKVLL